MRCLGKLRKFVLIFFNDILILGRTWEEHTRHIEEVLSKVRVSPYLLMKPNGLWYDRVSSSWRITRLLLSGLLLQMSLKGFFGLCGFDKRLVKGFSHTAAPLTDLTKKGAFEWFDSTQISFKHFK